MQMNSRAASVATSLSRENCKSELNFDSELDLDLDYEEDIDSESKNGESANGSVTPRRMTDESVVCLSSDTEPDEGFERYRQKKSRNNISRSNFARELTRENQCKYSFRSTQNSMNSLRFETEKIRANCEHQQAQTCLPTWCHIWFTNKQLVHNRQNNTYCRDNQRCPWN